MLIRRTTAALLCIELGFLLHQRLQLHRASIQNLLPAADAATNKRTMRAFLLLGEDDCKSAVSFVEQLDALEFEHPNLSRGILVAGSDSARQRVVAAAENRSSSVTIQPVTYTQLQTLGIKPARHIGRLMLLDSRGHIALLTLVPATAREMAAVISLAASIVQREVERH